ncbi:MAG: response regulator [Bacteroidia bacterium]
MELHYSILIVDDNAHDQHLIRNFFKKMNPHVNVHSVNDGAELLDFFETVNRAELPRFIITDINMPRVGGVEVIKIMKKDMVLVDIPVYVLTSCADFKTKVKSMITGASGFYEKPLDPSGLKTIFEEILLRENLLVAVT